MMDFSKIKVGNTYDRPQLAKLWGYQSHQAFSRGVFTPVNTNRIILFVTKEKPATSTQYNDYIIDHFLYWDGEEKGGNNNRIINAHQNGEEIHLFYRYRHHQPFIYMGIVQYIDHEPFSHKPFEFIFKILDSEHKDKTGAEEPQLPYTERNTEKRNLVLSRIGQGKFRMSLFDLWDGCAVTGIKIPEILRASHIKPWKSSTNYERLDPFNGLLLSPTIDLLFDHGFVSFKDDGAILLSKRIKEQSALLNITEGGTSLTKIYESNIPYLDYHRRQVFLK
ncbi:HNH endonuclease [Pararcticibacter amylolyticus]|uniref:Uncharacterized protein n=1 Tax=Pararcticibacter amylolyticus TaxID=2173175 RepID=A0A2U2PGW5_9SPHI|nr:DUF3427 domain-containing protein [Pararcticibacter amylolyticus]PWG80646.1 hypothetical protein DDR33_11525 [Pararcticibacter amylolyticus]